MLMSRRSLLKTIGSAAAISSLAPLSSALASGAIKPTKESVLLVIDVQNCFLPTGTLPVGDGDQVIPVINALSKKFQNVVMTQDWHPAGHSSFASSHEGKAPFETVEMDYGTQVLWPDHCIQGTKDAELAAGLDIPHAQLIIRKGWNSAVDSYSAFREADKKTMTGLTGYLKERGVSEVYVCGLATDFCVAWSAIDATISEFNVSVIEDASRGIDLNGSVAQAWTDMKNADIARIQSSDFA